MKKDRWPLPFVCALVIGLLGFGPACATTNPASNAQVSRCIQRCEQLAGQDRLVEEVTPNGQSLHHPYVGTCRQQCALMSHDKSEEGAPDEEPDPFKPPSKKE